jgi:hypothetical protein
MKRGILLTGSLILVAGVGAVLADGDEQARPRPHHPIVAALDADMDGVISAEEIANAGAALAALDTDADGSLSQEETRPARPERAAGCRGPRDVMRHDVDGDGVVTLEEFTAHATEAFGMIDANVDGQIEQTEADAAAPPPDHRQGHGRQGGPRG